MIHLRSIQRSDEAFLWQMLFYAAHMHEEAGKTVADAQRNPALAKYVTNWGRPGDLGFVAIADDTGEAIGAVWVRLYVGANKAYSPTSDDIPELAMAVLPAYSGQGIGTRLLQQIIAAAHPHYPALALNVRADNPAFRFYQRFGFVVLNEMVNRVGGLSYDMRLTLRD
ncbi:MAG: GNAT family N-acetyltransferase [Caldilinea sp. CFX5]|nr:GNAT family N-acetyltransferase [Caldilinea sp. CFX5]